jgi:hypothetical protein
MCELHNEWLSLPTTIMPAGIVPGIIISLMIADIIIIPIKTK